MGRAGDHLLAADLTVQQGIRAQRLDQIDLHGKAPVARVGRGQMLRANSHRDLAARTIAAVEVALGLAGENTRIIPGHGPISSRSELVAYREMLLRARDGIQPLIEDGRTLEQIIAARPTADLDPEWADGFIRPAQFVRMVYTSLAR